MKLVSAGKIGFEDVDRALSEMTAGRWAVFRDDGETIPDHSMGLISSMQDNVSILDVRAWGKTVPASETTCFQHHHHVRKDD